MRPEKEFPSQVLIEAEAVAWSLDAMASGGSWCDALQMLRGDPDADAETCTRRKRELGHEFS